MLRLRMRQVCEQHRGKRLLRVRMRERGGHGLGHTVRVITRVRRKVCSVLTTQLIPQRTLTKLA
jgi:hypothetical protein